MDLASKHGIKWVGIKIIIKKKIVILEFRWKLLDPLRKKESLLMCLEDVWGLLFKGQEFMQSLTVTGCPSWPFTS